MASGEGLDARIKTGGSHQQGSQEDRDQMGRGTGGSGGQAVGIVSHNASQMNQ